MFSNVLLIGHALVDIIEITFPDAMYFITAADIFLYDQSNKYS